ncbi:polymer-forming cytoskeletal protein [Acetobacteraceae bacterium KSS8]|uniref:Polymer-forming cytoskeletal protein n=2 Tax=Endosaccharibacter trunci TaxID=2812733 RepID=A0ABT1W9Q4_9PROT|nr:polymer-forming cytoskeletal protein [Acetobacteraceae bacterium KSS8]
MQNGPDAGRAPPEDASSPVSTPTAPKEAPMGRSPFPAPPSPPSAAPAAAQPAQPGAAPRAPMPGAAPGQPGGPAAPKKDAVERRTLVVGRGISVQGVVQDAERLVVEGTVEATMIHAAELSVAPGGVFRGEVEVEDAELAGTVDGTLTARGNLTIRATGRLIGTAKCRRLQVEDGGQVTGRLEMITEGATRAATPLGEPITASRPAPVPTPALDPAAPPA